MRTYTKMDIVRAVARNQDISEVSAKRLVESDYKGIVRDEFSLFEHCDIL